MVTASATPCEDRWWRHSRLQWLDARHYDGAGIALWPLPEWDQLGLDLADDAKLDARLDERDDLRQHLIGV